MSALDAQAFMRREHIRRAPVIQDGKLVGIVTEGDLLNASPTQATLLSVWEINYLVSKIKVSQVMSKKVMTIDEHTPIEEAARVMIDNKIGGLPVTRDGKVVGIITETDLFKIMLEMLGARQIGVRASVLVHNRAGEIAGLSSAISAAGGNIIALGTFSGDDPSTSELMFKVAGPDEVNPAQPAGAAGLADEGCADLLSRTKIWTAKARRSGSRRPVRKHKSAHIAQRRVPHEQRLCAICALGAFDSAISPSRVRDPALHTSHGHGDNRTRGEHRACGAASQTDIWGMQKRTVFQIVRQRFHPVVNTFAGVTCTSCTISGRQGQGSVGRLDQQPAIAGRGQQLERRSRRQPAPAQEFTHRIIGRDLADLRLLAGVQRAQCQPRLARGSIHAGGNRRHLRAETRVAQIARKPLSQLIGRHVLEATGDLLGSGRLQPQSRRQKHLPQPAPAQHPHGHRLAERGQRHPFVRLIVDHAALLQLAAHLVGRHRRHRQLFGQRRNRHRTVFYLQQRDPQQGTSPRFRSLSRLCYDCP
jgi:acetoin utilization protein AcuB